jgi:r-opsin
MFLYVAWTPYLVINFGSIFEIAKISPLGSIWGSVFAKANSIYNPIVYGISHPKYRAALHKTFPSLMCGDDPASDGTQSAVTKVSEIQNEKPAA